MPAFGARLHCPYCYEEFPERDILFRCTGRVSRQGKRCGPEIDELLRARTGYTGALPPTFSHNGRMTSAACPRCGDESTTRICPACHSQLPVHFGKVHSRLIALVGAKEAGKTVFMTVLVHELMHRAGERLNAAISGADDQTRLRFAGEYERRLYHDSRLLAPTTTAGTPNRVPLVFRFTTESRGPLGLNSRLGRNGPFGAGEPHHTLLSFFDTAGEDLQSQQSVEQNVRYLAAADGIVLLLDPLQMRGARGLAAPGTRLPTPGAAGDEPANVLANITDLALARGGRKPTERINKPLAIVFTKMDTLLHDLKDTSPLLRPPAEMPYFDEGDSLAVHAEIQRLLARWEGSRIDQFARLHYRRYRYFGVSALGETPTQENRVSPRGIRPYRVTGPLMWILAQFGAIPTRRG
jgi:Double-GTPase 2